MTHRLLRRLLQHLRCKLRLRIYLASGQSFLVYCDEYLITYDRSARIQSFSFDGASLGSFPFHIVPTEIVAIVREG